MAADTPIAGVLTVASIWSATAYGVSVDAVIVASIPTLTGAFARVGFEVARAADSEDKVRWSRVAYLFGGTLISTPTISILGLILLQLAHANSDPAAFFGLTFAGFVGPKSILWMADTISSAINRATGWKIPRLGTPKPQGTER